MRLARRSVVVIALLPLVLTTAACGSAGSPAPRQGGPAQQQTRGTTAGRPAARLRAFVSERYGVQQRLDRDEDGPGRGAGLAWAATCSDGYDVENVATLHGRRGYVAFLASPTGLDDAGDRRVFESIRRSFRFDGAP